MCIVYQMTLRQIVAQQVYPWLVHADSCGHLDQLILVRVGKSSHLGLCINTQHIYVIPDHPHKPI